MTIHSPTIHRTRSVHKFAAPRCAAAPSPTATRRTRGAFDARSAYLLLALMAVLPDCQAYVDPNVGGFIYQLLFPLLVAVAAGWRWIKMGVSSAWRRLVARLTGRPAATTESQATETPAPPEDR